MRPHLTALGTLLAATACLNLALSATEIPARKEAKVSPAAKKTNKQKPTTPVEPAPADWEYPAAARGEQTDDYHGTTVADPYRWLEETDSEPTRAWIAAQNQLTESYLADIKQREMLRQRITDLWNYEKFGLPTARGGRYLYSRNDGLQNQSVLYVAAGLSDEPRLLLDPNTLSADGTVALSGYALSDDGQHLAYGIARAGSDWQEWHVRDVNTGKDLPDQLDWVKFSGASWTADGRGFYYSRYDEPDEKAKLTGTNYFQKLFFHKLGTPQSDDQLIYERQDEKEWGFHGGVTDDGAYLIIHVRRSTETQNQIFYQDLQTPGAPVVELLTGFDARYSFIGNDGPLFWFQTDLDAPRGRVIAIDTGEPAREKWHTLVPEAAETLDTVTLIGGHFIASYLKDAHSQVQVFDTTGTLVREVELPGLGTAGGFDGRADNPETFYAFTGFTSPTVVYRYDVATGESTVFRAPTVDFKADDYETTQVFYNSKDGTRVPMFLCHKKGLKLDGSNPTLLYGYGGFDISLTPSFSSSRVAWLEMGGVYAVANLRGGGEYGRPWHEAGMKEKKQNVFDDFIAAAEWLIEHKYTSSEKLAITGRSNGGLLVGACMAQRPELFAAAIPGVGVMDMLRFHKFTIGWAWVGEYGSSDDAEQFRALHAYSPLHNLKPGTKYPATLVITADHDDRVVPGHSFKFAAALQAAQSGDSPTLIRIETSAGHGAGTPTTKLIDEATDLYAFLIRALKVTE